MILIVYMLGVVLMLRGVWVMLKPAAGGHQYIGMAELVLGLAVVVIAMLVS